MEVDNENTISSQTISIFPNPAKNWIQLNGAASTDSKLLIYNYLGQIEFEENIDVTPNINLYVGFLKPGIYILQITNTNLNSQNIRLIIQ